MNLQVHIVMRYYAVQQFHVSLKNQLELLVDMIETNLKLKCKLHMYDSKYFERSVLAV